MESDALYGDCMVNALSVSLEKYFVYGHSMESDTLYGDCMVNALSVSLGKYLVSIICRNYGDSMETVWRVILYMEIVW